MHTVILLSPKFGQSKGLQFWQPINQLRVSTVTFLLSFYIEGLYVTHFSLNSFLTDSQLGAIPIDTAFLKSPRTTKGERYLNI